MKVVNEKEEKVSKLPPNCIPNLVCLCLHCLVACVFLGRGTSTSSGGFKVFLIVQDMSADSVEPIL